MHTGCMCPSRRGQGRSQLCCAGGGWGFLLSAVIALCLGSVTTCPRVARIRIQSFGNVSALSPCQVFSHVTALLTVPFTFVNTRIRSWATYGRSGLFPKRYIMDESQGFHGYTSWWPHIVVQVSLLSPCHSHSNGLWWSSIDRRMLETMEKVSIKVTSYVRTQLNYTISTTYMYLL